MSLEQILLNHQETMLNHQYDLQENTAVMRSIFKMLADKYRINDEQIILAADEAKLNTTFQPLEEEPAIKKKHKVVKTLPQDAAIVTEQNGKLDTDQTNMDSVSTATVSPSNEGPSYEVTSPLITRISIEHGIAKAKAFLADFGLKSLRELEGKDLTAIHNAALAVLKS